MCMKLLPLNGCQLCWQRLTDVLPCVGVDEDECPQCVHVGVHPVCACGCASCVCMWVCILCVHVGVHPVCACVCVGVPIQWVHGSDCI